MNEPTIGQNAGIVVLSQTTNTFYIELSKDSKLTVLEILHFVAERAKELANLEHDTGTTAEELGL